MNAEFAGIERRTNVLGGFRADIRDYARWEYGRSDVAWLYALAANRRNAARRRARVARLIRNMVALFAIPTPENRAR